jgi:hypothetical protein
VATCHEKYRRFHVGDWVDDCWPPAYEPLPVHPPSSWLLTVGWRLYGLIDPREVPGARRRKR